MKKTIISFITAGACLFFYLAPHTPAQLHGRTKVQYANENNSAYTMTHTSYEFDGNSEYEIGNDTYKVSTMSFSKETLGSLSITGDLTQKTTFRQTEAYGVNSGSPTLSYAYDGSLQTDTKENWNLYADDCTYIKDDTTGDTIWFSGSISKGVLLLQKSSDGQSWSNAANPIVNYFESNTSGTSNLYSMDGSDVAQGTYYRAVVAYKTIRKSGQVLWVENYEYKRHIEVYQFYVCKDSINLSIHNLSVSDSRLDYDELSIDDLKKGETLENGDTTIDGFSLDCLGASYLLRVSKDGGAKTTVGDGYTAQEPGKYDITVTTRLGGATLTKTIYVFSGGDDCGFSTYFGNGWLSGERVFRNGNYPTYAKNSKFHVNAVSAFVPALTGTLTNTNTNETITFDGTDREEHYYDLSAGFYQGVLYSGNSSSGSMFRYSFNFNVIDEESKPYLNYNNLMSTNNVADLTSKHYEVAYQTTKGGYIYVCFSMDSYDDAKSYAYEIEKRFIEKAEDGELYYKSIENPNKKVKYVDEIEMTAALNYYAKKNVEINYFNAADSFTYQTLNDDSLSTLEALNLDDSIRIFPDAEEREKCTSRRPYLNGFSFISVGDYDSTKISAYCYKTGKTFDLEYGKTVDSQLSTSSKYTITETNVYGKTNIYDAYYVNENQTETVWTTKKDSISQDITVNSQKLTSNSYTISADSVSLSSFSNSIDEDCIVTIKAPDAYSYELKCMVKELHGVTFYKKGSYDLCFVDRLGNSYHLILNISGKIRYSEANTNDSDKKTYSDIYNSVHLHALSSSEEIAYDSSKLKSAIDRKVDSNLYTSDSYSNYLNALGNAINVYDDMSSTQDDLDKAYKKLEDAYNNLVKSADRTELSKLLMQFENTDENKYTPSTFAALRKIYIEGMTIYLKNDPTVDEISDVVNRLKKAFEALLEKGDKTLLEAKLKEAKEIVVENYTTASITNLDMVYKEAYAVYKDEESVQIQIDAALEKLTKAMDALVVHADFDDLYICLLKAQALQSKNYTKSSWISLNAKYQEAVSIYKDLDSTQVTIDHATFNLTQAMNNLVLAGDSATLQALINEISTIDVMLYTSDSVNDLVEKYNEAKDAIENRESQNVLNRIYGELSSKKQALVERSDKKELKNLLDTIQAKDTSSMSEDDYNSLRSAYDAATDVYNNLEATEDDVRQAIDNINSILTKKYGCGGSIQASTGALSAISLLGFAILLKKRSCIKHSIAVR